MTNRFAAAFSAAMMAFSAIAATNYVDCVNGVDETGRGGSLANAWKTLQYAVDKSAAGDTILVAPGEYKEGGSTSCRMYIKKKLTIKSIEGPERTHIVGATGDDGVAVTRCGAISSAGADTIIYGFTLRDGTENNGAAILGKSDDEAVYVVGCVVSNCISDTSTFAYSRLVRCLVTDNYGAKMVNYCHALNTIFTRNRGTDVTCYARGIVNCTFAANGASYAVRNRTSGNAPELVWNTLFLYDRYSGPNTLVATNCVATKPISTDLRESGDSFFSQPFSQIMSPEDCDWRVVKGSTSETAGNAEHLARFTLPSELENERYRDFYGNTIPNSGTIAVGAVQTTADAVCGMAVSSTNVLIRGRQSMVTGIMCYYDSWPRQVRVRAVDFGMPPVFFSWCGGYPLPERDGSYLLTLGSNFTQKVSVVLAKSVLYVDKSIGDDSYSGTAATVGGEVDGVTVGPKASIQGAVDVAGTSSTMSSVATVIYVAPGDYDSGERAWNGSNRVYVASRKYVRIIATGGVDETIIRGAADPNADSADKGLGPAAVRCVGWASDYGGLQGFTLTDGHTTCTELASAGDAHMGGAFYSSTSTGIYLSDCVMSNNVGEKASIANGGWLNRCFLIDNDHHREGYDGVRQSILSSCVLYGNMFPQNPGDLGLTARAYQCTIKASSGKSYFRGPPQCVCNCIVFDSKSDCALKWGGAITNTAGVLTLRGTLYDNVDEKVAEHAGGYVEGSAAFVDKDARDFRITSLSDAIGAGVNGSEDFLVDTTLTNYCRYVSTDIEGNPITFTDGKPTVGAYQRALLAVEVKGRKVTPAAGNYVLEPNGSLTVTATSARGFRGFKVNGEMAEGRELSYTIAAGSGTNAKGGISIEPVYQFGTYFTLR